MLIMMPVAVLVVVMLGAMAVDAAALFGAQRSLAGVAAAAANDAVARSVDAEAFYRQGQIELDSGRVAQTVSRACARRADDGLVSELSCSASLAPASEGEVAVEVTATATVTVESLGLPFGAVGPFTMSGSHTETVDPLRSGLAVSEERASGPGGAFPCGA